MIEFEQPWTKARIGDVTHLSAIIRGLRPDELKPVVSAMRERNPARSVVSLVAVHDNNSASVCVACTDDLVAA